MIIGIFGLLIIGCLMLLRSDEKQRFNTKRSKDMIYFIQGRICNVKKWPQKMLLKHNFQIIKSTQKLQIIIYKGKYVEAVKKQNTLIFMFNVHSHILRSSIIMHLLENDVNLVYIRDFLGH